MSVSERTIVQGVAGEPHLSEMALRLAAREVLLAGYNLVPADPNDAWTIAYLAVRAYLKKLLIDGSPDAE